MLLMVTCRYGTFSDGLGADERPYVWEGSVVTLYAETNRGMSGVVLSTKFSVGYLVHSDAAAARLRFATLLNTCLLYTSPSPRDGLKSRMPSSA